MTRNIFEDFTQEYVIDDKEQPWWLIFLTFVVYISLIAIIVFGIYTQPWSGFLSNFTAGLITSTLVFSLMIFLIVIVLLIGLIGKLRPFDYGLRKSKILPSFSFYLILYLSLNFVWVILNLIIFSSPNFYPYWQDIGFLNSIGRLIGQIFGNVFVEESFFRGYLFPRISQKLLKKEPEKPLITLMGGAIISNLLFSVMHIPIRLLNGVIGLDLIISLLTLFGIGFLFTIIFILSGNLFIAMVVHIMTNISFSLFSPVFAENIVIYIIASIMICAIACKKLKVSKDSSDGNAISKNS